MKFGMGKRAQFFPKPGDRPKDEFPRSQVYIYLQVYEALTKVPNDHALAMAYNTEIDPMIGQPRAHPVTCFGNTSLLHLTMCDRLEESPSGGLELNDLTKLYMNVVKVNQRLLDMTTDQDKFNRSESSLFKAVTQATTHQTPFGTPAMTQKFGGDGAINSALEGMYDRIKPPGQKKNHIRRINQSKVTEHTLYSVITPNPALRIDEVGVPIGACIRLTVAEKVTKENIEEMRAAIIKGHPLRKKGAGGMNEEMETYFGGAKYYEQLEPNPSPTSLVDEINGVYDPFRIDPETGRQANPMAQDAWYQEVLPGD